MSAEIEIKKRSFAFAVRIVRLCRVLEQQGNVSRTLANQLLRSGTSIGANIEEAQAEQSNADFTAKMSIARKEAPVMHHNSSFIPQNSSLAPDFNYGMSGLILTFHANPRRLNEMLEGKDWTDVSTTPKTTQETTQEKILHQLRTRHESTRKDLAEVVGLTPDGVKYHLDKLRKAGVIQHTGPTKAGRWEVRGNDE